MLNNRQISEIFEVQINTLYNWQKSKPNLHNYLKNADYNFSRNEEINILLDEYSKTFQKNFSKEELEYLVESSFELLSIEDIKNFGKAFLKMEYKKIPKQSNFLFGMYDKISTLNIIEKYILYKKIYRARKIGKDLNFEEFFKEFLQ
jgi:predicted Zn-dependent protease